MLKHGFEATLRALSLTRSLAKLEPDLIRDVLAEIVTHAQVLPASKHPLGFAHLELTEALGTDHRVRLHVWTDSTRQWADDMGRLHDHTWELYSSVLLGGLTDSTLEPEPCVDGDYRATCIEYAESGNVARDLEGRWRLVVTRKREVTAGESYSLPPGVVHLTQIDHWPTVTLVAAVETAGVGPRVFVPVDGVDSEAAPRPKLDGDWVAAEVSSLLDLVPATR